jgi:hypothetical protein
MHATLLQRVAQLQSGGQQNHTPPADSISLPVWRN